MALKPQEAKATLVEKAIAHVRERLPGPQTGDVERFVRAYSADAAPEDLSELDLYGAALAHWHLLQRRRPGELKVRYYTPTLEEHGWQSTHSVVESPTTCLFSSTRLRWRSPVGGPRSTSSSTP